MMKWDGHTHTQFCKHGSDRPLRAYAERAAELGFERYTATEHPPLPEGWVDDPVLTPELAMDRSELPLYLADATAVKRAFEGRLDVTVGLEMDYLHGRESFTEELLSEASAAAELEDVIISVHYLPGRGGMRCVDYKPEDFRDNLLSYYGSMEKVADAYYDHVELAIRSAASWRWRRRLGHVNLIEKFRSALPPIDEAQIRERLQRLLPLLVESGVGIDANAAGLRKATCGKPYTPEWFLAACAAQGVEIVFGSDAHRPEEVGAGWDWFAASLPGSGTAGDARRI
ncbi:histidinol-phosphatase HisJ [Paenibacillus sp.]|uniref:histidinol-phosphatase HisJ n=1 Tax=Paenibacillus sp. TaxID=58172 RepID=UPI002D407991|nr:histidinol-phosphatase HisJ [Paenibacillus sp.]HZG54987.1 histidinol-phosphatase HisJ [Paenibacillus sp.]